MSKQKPLSWKARRNGKVYCAPACGMGCTWEKYLEAKRAGEALAKRMGPGWAAVVHENMGWYYCARYKQSGVHVSQHGLSYTASIGDDYPLGIWVANARSPKAALEQAVEAAQEHVRRYKEMVQVAVEALSEKKR